MEETAEESRLPARSERRSFSRTSQGARKGESQFARRGLSPDDALTGNVKVYNST